MADDTILSCSHINPKLKKSRKRQFWQNEAKLLSYFNEAHGGRANILAAGPRVRASNSSTRTAVAPAASNARERVDRD
jgi:hypothetical protein